MLIYEEVEKMLDTNTTSIQLVDDCGNSCDCIFIFGSAPYLHCRIGGQWKRFVDARRLREGVKIRLGVLVAGQNDTLYVTDIVD